MLDMNACFDVYVGKKWIMFDLASYASYIYLFGCYIGSTCGNDLYLYMLHPPDLDEKLQPITLGRPKKKLMGLLPGGKMLSNLLEMINMEFCTNGQPLWLFRP